jgi:phage terminase small subunit
MRELPVDNAKHEHFCQLVANGESATQAYVLAGYSDKGAAASANRLLKNAEICDRIAYLRALKEQDQVQARQQAIERTALTKEWIIQQLMENVAMAKQAEPVRDSEGNETGEYKQNLPAANKALEMLGTEIGMFIKKAEIGKPGEFQDLTDDELERQLADADRALAASDSAIQSARNKAAQTSTAEGKAAPARKA